MTTHPSLAIGAVAGGPGTSRKWTEAVQSLGRRVIAAREGVTSPLAVNVVYQIPGEHLEPEFIGVRSGRFSRKDARLLVQVALPPEPSLEPDQEVRALLRDAIGLAEDFARQEGMIIGGLEELRGLLDRV